MYSTARPREQIVEYQKGVTGANVERAVFSNDSALPRILSRNKPHWHNRPAGVHFQPAVAAKQP
jgi:hypothetical protein